MMWALVLIVYINNVNDAQLGIIRRFTSLEACEAAGDIAKNKVRPGFRFDYFCLPSRT